MDITDTPGFRYKRTPWWPRHPLTFPIDMTNKSQLRIVSLLFISLAAACSGSGDTPVTDSPRPVPSEITPAASVGSQQGKYLRATPNELAVCKPGQSVEISWDLAGDFPGVTGVDIFVGTDEAPKLFSSGGAVGTTRTGTWTTPGTTFRLMNKKSREEIERIVIGGPTC